MSYEGCDVTLHCLPRCEGMPLRYDSYTNRKRKKKNRGFSFIPAPEGGGVR